MNNHTINDILFKTISGEQLSSQEQVLLDEWLAADEKNREMFLNWKDEDYVRKKLTELHQFDVEAAKRKIDEKMYSGGKVAFLGGKWIQYAAAVMLTVVIATYFWLNRSTPAGTPTTDNKNVAVQQNDVGPGQSKAMLTLSDGRKIVLDSGTVGSLDEKGKIVIKNKDGQLVYQPGRNTTGEILYNTLTTGKGETYSIVLSDGTIVTLNSASSIRYPIVFPSGERKTEVTGEAFFDVTHNAGQPFVVTNRSKGIDVKVLGTRFNVNTYEEERARVTLIEGSVMVRRSGQNPDKPVVIKPGQQAFVSDEDQLAVASNVNIEEVLAWKNGLFYFHNASITTVMRQLERWYNITVVYEGHKPTQAFGGELQRSLNLSQVIRALEHTGVRFKIEGRKLIVMQ